MFILNSMMMMMFNFNIIESSEDDNMSDTNGMATSDSELSDEEEKIQINNNIKRKKLSERTKSRSQENIDTFDDSMEEEEGQNTQGQENPFQGFLGPGEPQERIIESILGDRKSPQDGTNIISTACNFNGLLSYNNRESIRILCQMEGTILCTL
jgi:hypothetical protein